MDRYIKIEDSLILGQGTFGDVSLVELKVNGKKVRQTSLERTDSVDDARTSYVRIFPPSTHPQDSNSVHSSASRSMPGP
jgi:hypothetical protein